MIGREGRRLMPRDFSRSIRTNSGSSRFTLPAEFRDTDVTVGSGREFGMPICSPSCIRKSPLAQANPHLFREPTNRIPCSWMKNDGLHTFKGIEFETQQRRPAPSGTTP
jgi:hypothetical protein